MSDAKYQRFGVIRDKTTGKPKFDDPATAHPVQLMMCSPEERASIPGLRHAGDWAECANGYQPVTKTAPGVYTADSDLQACRGILTSRVDENGKREAALIAFSGGRRDFQKGAVINTNTLA